MCQDENLYIYKHSEIDAKLVVLKGGESGRESWDEFGLEYFIDRVKNKYESIEGDYYGYDRLLNGTSALVDTWHAANSVMGV